MDVDLWDRQFDDSDHRRWLERENEQRDAEELARIERLYDKGGMFLCSPCECGGHPECPRCYPAEISDPKHPRHHEVMADVWDAMT